MIDTTKPMGAARYVRRERYAWPGGYPLALITTDGGFSWERISAAEAMRIIDSLGGVTLP